MRTLPSRWNAVLLAMLSPLIGTSDVRATGTATLSRNDGTQIYFVSDAGGSYVETLTPPSAFYLKAGTYFVSVNARCLLDPCFYPAAVQIVGFTWILRFPTDVQLGLFEGSASVVAWAGETIRDNSPVVAGSGIHNWGYHAWVKPNSFSCPGGFWADADAQSTVNTYADPRNISLLVDTDANVSSVMCQGNLFCGHGDASGDASQGFTLTNDMWAVFSSSVVQVGGPNGPPPPPPPPPGGNPSFPAQPGDGSSRSNSCNVNPVYLWTNATSGLSFTYPGSSPKIQFAALNGALFTSISNFPPTGSYLVEVAGLDNGPFTNGQSFSFADLPGGGVDQFLLLPLSGGTEPWLSLQLTFSAPTADFQAQSLAPSPVAILLNRLSAGLPPTGSVSNVLAYAETVRLDALVPGGCTNTYQWRREGQPLQGETNASLSLSNMLPTQVGLYSVAVSNELGLAASADMALRMPPPAIRLLSPSVATNTFQATVTGLPPGVEFVLEYSTDLVQWLPMATNTATAMDFHFEAPAGKSDEKRFYRATTRW
jgi:hypothetical protein